MNERLLFANGCSMTYGSELGEDHQLRMASTWVGQLAQRCGFSKAVNLGYPGSSNDRILRTTIEWINKQHLTQAQPMPLFVCIGWSSPMRREFYIDGQWRQLIPYHDYQDKSASLFNRLYRELAWHETECALRFVTQLISLQSFLQVHQIPYLFFDAITSFADTNLEADQVLTPYLPTINQNRYVHFNEKNGSMADVLGTCALQSPQAHPNREQHQRWSSLLFDFINQHRLIPNLLESTTDPIYEGTQQVILLDKKIGLSKSPPKSTHLTTPTSKRSFERVAACHEPKTETAEESKAAKDKRFWRRLYKAKQKDPFIYD